jgi:hypothetical protein
MKVRYGHISNSSSSSFIIATDKPLDSLESIKKQVFKNAGDNSEGWVSSEYGYDPLRISDLCEGFLAGIVKGYGDEHWDDAKEEYITETVPLNTFEDILSNEDILDSIGFQCLYDHRTLDGQYDAGWPNYTDSVAVDKYEKKWAKIRKELALKYLETVKDKFREKCITYANYADEDGRLGSQLEHGNHWDTVTHIRISHH